MAQSRTGSSTKAKTRSAPGATKTTRRRPAAPSVPTLTSYNPATGKVLAEIDQTLPSEVADLVGHARKVAPEWAAIDPRGRAHMLKEVRHKIYERIDDIVDTVATENGKARVEALSHDVLPTLLMLTYQERAVAKALKPTRIGRFLGPALGSSSYIEWRPFGVVGAIGPWNYPFFNTFLAFSGALFAGNTVVVKPSEVTPQVGELIRDVLDPLPPGVATVIQGGGDVGAALVDAPCDKISFIGSPPTGRKICEAAAKHLTPVVMELGGKDAAVVCPDADLDAASSGVLWASFMNAGQTCCAIERVFVADSIADEFMEQLLDKAAKLRQDPEGDVGSLTFKRQLDIVSRQVDDAVKKGAKVLIGGPKAGRRNTGGSLWYAPTIVDHVSDDMDVIREETFGPVVSVTRVSDDDEAIERANSGVNLTASVWTGKPARGRRLAQRLRAGTVTVNSHGDSLGVPWAPWGGVGESGFGRLGGELGLREFTVPVHVSRSLTPKMKRLWWYPYNESMLATVRAMAQVLGAPGAGTKARAVRSVLRNVRKTIKTKI